MQLKMLMNIVLVLVGNCTVSCVFQFSHVCVQKSDGTCNTNFKRTKYKEEVMQALDDFVDHNVSLLVCEEFFLFLF